MAVHTVDSRLGEAAVLAIILHPHSGLEDKSVRKSRRNGLGENAVVHDIHKARSLLARRIVSRSAEDDFVYGETFLLKLEVGFIRFSLFEFQLYRAFFVAHGRRDHFESAHRQVAHSVMP